ncbi:MAG: transcriptional regulator, partial [Cyanobacteria bacterium J06614_10]
EAENYPVKAVSPSDVLRHILQVSDVRSADLVGVLGSERVITEILNGDRDISLAQASILADRFKVSPELFLR